MAVVTPDIPAAMQRTVADKCLTFVLGSESHHMANIKDRGEALLDIDRVVSYDTVTHLAMAATPVVTLPRRTKNFLSRSTNTRPSERSRT